MEGLLASGGDAGRRGPGASHRVGAHRLAELGRTASPVSDRAPALGTVLPRPRGARRGDPGRGDLGLGPAGTPHLCAAAADSALALRPAPVSRGAGAAAARGAGSLARRRYRHRVARSPAWTSGIPPRPRGEIRARPLVAVWPGLRGGRGVPPRTRYR